MYLDSVILHERTHTSTHPRTPTHTHTPTDDVEFFSAERKCPNKDFGVDSCNDSSPWNPYTNVSCKTNGMCIQFRQVSILIAKLNTHKKTSAPHIICEPSLRSHTYVQANSRVPILHWFNASGYTCWRC